MALKMPTWQLWDPVRRASLFLVPPVAVFEWNKGAMGSSKICTVHCAVEDSTAVLLHTHTRDQRDLI